MTAVAYAVSAINETPNELKATLESRKYPVAIDHQILDLIHFRLKALTEGATSESVWGICYLQDVSYLLGLIKVASLKPSMGDDTGEDLPENEGDRWG